MPPRRRQGLALILRGLAALLRAGAVASGMNSAAALVSACRDNHTDIVKLLTAAGADVESEKTHGGRPLHTAADTNQADIIVALLECGAKRDSLLMDDTTALYLAAQNGTPSSSRLLSAAFAQDERL